MVRKKAGQTGQGRSLQPAWSDRVWRRGRQARQVEACSLLGVIEPEGGEVRLENRETNKILGEIYSKDEVLQLREQYEACSLLGVIEPEGGGVRLENYETNNMKDFFRQAKEENVRCCRCADDLRER